MRTWWNTKSLAIYLLLSVIASNSCLADKISAQLSGFEEVPAIFTDGTGAFDGTFGRETIDYTLTYLNPPGKPSTAQLRFGQRGVIGGTIAFLCGGGNKPPCPPNRMVTGTVFASDIQGPVEQGIVAGGMAAVLAAIRSGVVYVEVSSEQGPEIRGQVHVINPGGVPQSDSGIKGKVVLGPVCSVVRDPPDPNCANRPYQAVVVVKTTDGLTEITRFFPDSDGDFHTSIPPGTYQLTQVEPGMRPYLLPITVTVLAGAFTNVTILFDTGVR